LEEERVSAKESVIGLDHAVALALASAGEKGQMKARWRIEKYLGDFKRPSDIPAWLKPFEVKEFDYNLLLNEGINELWKLVCGTGAAKFDASNAYIGVGDDAAAASASQEGLQASTNKLYKAMDSPYPTYGTDQKATWRSTFGSSDANFAWNEITVANGNSDSAKNLNRKVQAMGTKAVGTTWVATLEITLA
jgi:hypothetical protein